VSAPASIGTFSTNVPGPLPLTLAVPTVRLKWSVLVLTTSNVYVSLKKAWTRPSLLTEKVVPMRPPGEPAKS